MRPSVFRSRASALVLSTALVAGCSSSPWDPGYAEGLQVKFRIKSSRVSTKHKWIEGEVPVEQSGTILVGNELRSSGTLTSTQELTVERTWHFIGQGVEHVGNGFDYEVEHEDAEHRPVYWVEGVDVASGTRHVEGTEIQPGAQGAVFTSTFSEDETMNGASTAYQLALVGAHGSELGADGFVYGRLVSGEGLDDLEGLLGRIDPEEGDIWAQGDALYRVLESEDVKVGSDTVSAAKVEIRRVQSRDLRTADVGALCLGEHVEKQEGSSDAPGGGDFSESATSVTLNPACENGLYVERAGLEWWYGNLPVKAEGTRFTVEIDEYGFEWVECDNDGQPERRRTSTEHPGDIRCGTARKFVEYTVHAEQDRTVELVEWKEEVELATK